MTLQQQLDVLGIGASAFQGLVIVEIDGPPIVTMTPTEARRFYIHYQRAYGDAIREADALRKPRDFFRQIRADRQVEVEA